LFNQPPVRRIQWCMWGCLALSCGFCDPGKRLPIIDPEEEGELFSDTGALFG
jgi:hypothetical protein